DSARNVRRSTSGARLEPPIPSRTTASRPSSATSSANAVISSTRSRMRRGSSSQPSHFASSAPVQTVGSRSQIRSIRSARCIRCSGRRELASLRADALEQLAERGGELLYALELERLGHVVVVDADTLEPGEDVVRLVEALGDCVAAHLAVILERRDRLL